MVKEFCSILMGSTIGYITVTFLSSLPSESSINYPDCANPLLLMVHGEVGVRVGDDNEWFGEYRQPPRPP
jgi:hypothetical protein